MKFIIFGKFSYNHIYFLCYAIVVFFVKILDEIILENNYKVSDQFYNMYVLILSRSLAIIPYLINKHLSKRRNIKTEENFSDKGINYIYNDKENKFSKKLIISTLKVSIFEFLGQALLCVYMFFNDKPEVNSYYTLQINIILNTITQYMVSYLILNYQFYKHHYLSFGINIGCIIFLIIVDT